jgi:hypothetical protein
MPRIGSLLVARQSLRSSALKCGVHIKVEDDADLNHPPIYYFATNMEHCENYMQLET